MNKEQFVKHYAVERKNSISLKWDLLQQRFGDPDLIPMGVADMDFRTPECITDALHRRVAHGAYGYAYIPDSYYEACFGWMENRYGFRPRKEMLRLTNGIVAAMYYFVHAFTEPGDSIIINTPVYYPFAGAIRDCGRKVVSCDMEYDHGHFSIDPDKFEKDIVEHDVKMYFLCSPHNPCGRVWTEEELAQKAPKIIVCDLEGTYLPMLDLRNIIDVEHPTREPVVLNGKAPVNYDVYDFVQVKCRLAVDYGEWFGEKYSGLFRLNLATTPETIKTVVDHIVDAYNQIAG